MRGRAVSNTQSGWTEWGRQRIADGPRIAKLYERQGKAMAELIESQGCECNPSILFRETPSGPTVTDPVFTHALDCKRGI